jgi:hypothetical protein
VSRRCNIIINDKNNDNVIIISRTKLDSSIIIISRSSRSRIIHFAKIEP